VKCCKLFLSIFGVCGSLLIYGVFQERVMKVPYDDKFFKDFIPTNLIIFCSRGCACILSFTVLISRGSGGLSGVPFYNYSLCSLSNILGSWFQLEALKVVSFSTLVIFKGSRILPVMAMGYCISKTKYDMIEWLIGGFFAAGISIFMCFKEPQSEENISDTIFGLVILCLYIICDAFTSNWQDKLYKKYKMSNYEMMFGVAACSMIFLNRVLK
jgi:adenosine 3'-phospho 5'-phosphosulfate transporter B2